MHIIDQLETTARSIYCGAIGIKIPDKAMIFNVPIRTIEYHHVKQQMIYGVGGGITIQSKPELEYEEMVAKSRVVQSLDELPFHLIETMCIKNNQIKRIDEHIHRLSAACAHFNIPVSRERIKDEMNQFVSEQSFNNMLYKYRVTVFESGHMEQTIEPISVQKEMTSEIIPMDYHEEDYHRYKTSMRKHYKTNETHLALYYDQSDETMLEFNIGNLVYEINQELYTPTLNKPILNGCMRQSLLNKKKLKECDITLTELMDLYRNDAAKIYCINSLREWVEVTIVHYRYDK